MAWEGKGTQAGSNPRSWLLAATWTQASSPRFLLPRESRALTSLAPVPSRALHSVPVPLLCTDTGLSRNALPFQGVEVE